MPHFVDMYEVCRDNVINIDAELIASDPWATFIAKGGNVYNEIQMDVLYKIIFPCRYLGTTNFAYIAFYLSDVIEGHVISGTPRT